MVITCAKLAAQMPTVLMRGWVCMKISTICPWTWSVGSLCAFYNFKSRSLVLDLPELKWKKIPVTQTMVKGPVIGFRTGLFRSGVTRVVLDLKPKWKILRHFKLASQGLTAPSIKNDRIVIDLVKESSNFLQPQQNGQKTRKGKSDK